MTLTINSRNDMAGAVALIDWRAYSGADGAALALVLLLLGAGAVLLGRRRREGMKLPLPRRGTKVLVLLVWALSILLVLPMFRQVARETGQSVLGLGPVFPITLASALVTFAAVAYLTREGGALAALGNGFAAAAAGPMVFELPFVLIITPVATTRVPHPLVLFSTFLVVILTTLALPTFSSRFSVTRNSLYLLGAMLVVFAAWALATGYAPPADAVSFSLNAVSKVLGFAAVLAGYSALPDSRERLVAHQAQGEAL
jgi:hypothetical protein